MKRCLTAAVVAALVAALPALAYDEDDDVEEVVVTAPRMYNTLGSGLTPYGQMSEAELYFYQERARQNAIALAEACERARQDAIAAGAAGSIIAGATIACGHIKNSKANVGCKMAVAFAAGVCAVASGGGNSN